MIVAPWLSDSEPAFSLNASRLDDVDKFVGFLDCHAQLAAYNSVHKNSEDGTLSILLVDPDLDFHFVAPLLLC
jgi:hypothetical protein